MQISENFSTNKMILTCYSLALILTTGCENPDFEGLSSTDQSSYEENDWVNLLDELSFKSSIIVQEQGSIQDAVDAAKPGDVIYVEPGTYHELVTINKSNIELVGLNSGDGEEVLVTGHAGGIQVTGSGVQIFNIKYEDEAGLSTSYSQRETKRNKQRHLFKITRSQLNNNIAHYKFEVDLGDGEFDIVRIHRVVREYRQYRPVQTDGAVFMIHGSGQNFDDIYLSPGVDQPSKQTSAPLYLAANDIDVWGIDLAWTLVPLETTDFSFMKDWGMEVDVDHTLKAMALARIIRGLTRQGFDQLNLLGFSYGVGVAYAAAGRETQQRPVLRDIKGIVAAEGAMKYAESDEASRVANCNRALTAQAQINDGVYQNSNGIVFGLIGEAAANAPDELSNFVPGLTNFQAALFFGTSTFIQGDSPAPFWHFVGGEFGETFPVPEGLLYTQPSRWVQLLKGLPPYQPLLNGKDLNACLCNEEEVTIDDHLNEIKLPILYLGASGGFGVQGLFTSSLTKSTDFTYHIVNLQSEEQRALDFGHADLFMADQAAQLGWEFLRRWLVDHKHKFGA